MCETHSYHMSMNLYIFRMLIYFTRSGSIRFVTPCPTRKSPTGIACGLMHLPVMHALVIYHSMNTSADLPKQELQAFVAPLDEYILAHQANLTIKDITAAYTSPPNISANSDEPAGSLVGFRVTPC